SSAEPRWSAPPARGRSGRGTRAATEARSGSPASRRTARTARRRRARGSGRRRTAGAARPSAGRRPTRRRGARSRSGARGAPRRATQRPRTGPPAGGRSPAVRRWRSGLERGLGLRCDLAEPLGIAHRDVRENLAVERDLSLLEAGDELVVRQPVRPGGGVDPHDPEPPERPLLVLAVAVGVRQRVVDLLLGTAVAGVLEAPVAARLLEDLAALLARVHGSLDSRHAYLPSSFLTSRTSESATGWSRRKARLRLADFFSSRWAFGAFRRRSLPVPVTLNRFFVALCVFVFGMWFHSGVLRRTQHHHHVPAVLERRGLYLPPLPSLLRQPPPPVSGQPHQQVSPALRVALLPAAEHDRHLDLRALVEEAHDVAFLGVVVVNSDLGPELDLLDVHRDLVLPGELGLLLLLVAVLPVV